MTEGGSVRRPATTSVGRPAKSVVRGSPDPALTIDRRSPAALPSREQGDRAGQTRWLGQETGHNKGTGGSVRRPGHNKETGRMLCVRLLTPHFVFFLCLRLEAVSVLTCDNVPGSMECLP